MKLVRRKEMREKFFFKKKKKNAGTMALISITNNMSVVAPTIRAACEILGRVVERKGWAETNAVTFAISSFFFLRFVW